MQRTRKSAKNARYDFSFTGLFIVVQKNEDVTGLREESVALKAQIDAKEKEVADIQVVLASKVNKVASIVSPIAPVSADEEENKVLRMVGDATTNPQFLTHVDLVRMVDGVEYTNGLYRSFSESFICFIIKLTLLLVLVAIISRAILQ